MRLIQLSDLPGESHGAVTVHCSDDVELSYSGEALHLVGANRNQDIGLRIHVPEGAKLYTPELFFENCFMNIWKTGLGQLTVDGFTSREFGGDNANFRGSNVYIGETVVRDNTPTRPYWTCVREGNETIEACLERYGEEVYDPSLLKFEKSASYPGAEIIIGYHVDGIAQIFAAKSDGHNPDKNAVIENIIMPSIDAEISGKNSQGVMGSEGCEYKKILIGKKFYRVKLDGYPYHAVFNTLSDSSIGCEGAELDGKLKIQNVKHSKYTSQRNQVTGISEADVVCDPNAVQFVTADDRLELEVVTEPEGSEVDQLETPDTTVTEFELTEIPEMSLDACAAEDNLEVALLDAIINKESKGKTHYKGRVTKLFERHVNDRCLRRHGIDPADVIRADPSAQDVIGYQPYSKYGSYALQQTRFDKAFLIHEPSAIEACSWGFAQVLGENWEMCGFKSAYDFRHAMQTKNGQLYAFIQYLRNKPGLLDALRMKQWGTVKRLYNGAAMSDKDGDGVDDYTADLAREYTRAVLRRSPRKAVTKSRTMRSSAISAAGKVLGAGTIAFNADSFTGIVGQMVSGREKLEQVKDAVQNTKDTVLEVKESVAVIGDQLVFANDALSGLSYLPWALGFLLVLALIPHVRMAYTYMEDNGYTKGLSDVFK